MAEQYAPIAKDESFNTTDLTPKNIADVLQDGLATLASSVKPTADEIPFDNTGTSLVSTDVEGAIKEINSATKVSSALKASYTFPKSNAEIVGNNNSYTSPVDGIAFFTYQFNNSQYSQFELKINNVSIGQFNSNSSQTVLQSIFSFPVRKGDVITVSFYSTFTMNSLFVRIL